MSYYTFKEECDSCGNVPSYNGVGLCDPCTTGEADTLWDWLPAWESIPKSEWPLVVEYIDSVLMAEGLVKKSTKKGLIIDPLVAHLLKVDKQEIWDYFEDILQKADVVTG